jgi:hypothetical protein
MRIWLNLVKRNLVDRHLVNRHLVDRHLVNRHLVDRHSDIWVTVHAFITLPREHKLKKKAMFC